MKYFSQPKSPILKQYSTIDRTIQSIESTHHSQKACQASLLLGHQPLPRH
jgi:hypothetical protein